MPHVAVLVPGIMGSVLSLGKDVIWPGSVASLIFPYKKMAELLSPDLVATDCIRYFVLPQYQSIIDDLGTCGFDEQAHTLVVCAYDWRKPIESGAETLAKHLALVVAEHGPDVEISLVAHSMGGLVSRHYLESGRFNAERGFKNIGNLLMLGVPHRGAAIALPLVLGYEKQLFLSSAQVRELASNENYPGAYQLLPHSDQPIVWDTTSANTVPTADLYDPTVASRLGLVEKNLAAARSFQASLNLDRRPKTVRYFCFSGNRQTTTAYIRLQQRTTGLIAAKMEQENAGDGTVPIWSSSLNQTQFLYVAGEHGTIYKSRDLRSTLAVLLGFDGVLALGTATEIALRYTVVQPGADIEATLKLSVNTTELRGHIVIERLEMDAAGNIVSTPEVATYRIAYEGPVIETISTVLVAPSQRGHYRLSFHAEGAQKSSAAVELIVQDPLI